MDCDSYIADKGPSRTRRSVDFTDDDIDEISTVQNVLNLRKKREVVKLTDKKKEELLNHGLSDDLLTASAPEAPACGIQLYTRKPLSLIKKLPSNLKLLFLFYLLSKVSEPSTSFPMVTPTLPCLVMVSPGGSGNFVALGIKINPVANSCGSEVQCWLLCTQPA